MKRYYCNGKKGYCKRSSDGEARCGGCKYADGSGGMMIYNNIASGNVRRMVAREIVKYLRKSLKPYRTEYARTEPVTIENLHCSPIGARYVIPSYELEAVISLITEKYT